MTTKRGDVVLVQFPGSELDGLQLFSNGGDRMASVPVQQISTTKPVESVEQRFRCLEALWTAETGFLSSDVEIVGHPAFQEIIRMGDAVVPFMMQDLAKQSALWVWALPEITGTDPVIPGDRGNIRKMSEAWLRWGREHGYL